MPLSKGTESAVKLWYLDDLRVGQHFVSGSYTVEIPEMKAFARQYDPQPFHLDEEQAKGSFFGGLVASGWLTGAITMRLNVNGGLPIAGGLIGAGGELTWQKAVEPGDVLHVESEILEVTPSRSRADRGIVTVLSQTLNQHGDVVQLLKAKLVVPRRAQA